MLKRYEVVINGHPTTVQLTEQDARARGLIDTEAPEAAEAGKSRRPANKGRTVANKGE